MKKLEKDVYVLIQLAAKDARPKILSFLGSSGSSRVNWNEVESELSGKLPIGVAYPVWIAALAEAKKQLVARGKVVSEGEGEFECLRLNSRDTPG